MFDYIDERVTNKPAFFNQQKVKSDINKSLDVLSKVSPSQSEISTYNKIIIQRLQQYKTINVLLALLINAGGDNVRCSLIISFISHYLKCQVRPSIGQTRHDKKSIYQKIKTMFFCNTLTDKHKRMLQTCFSDFLSTLSPQFMKLRKSLCEQIVQFFTTQENPSSSDLANSLYLIEAVLTSNLQTQSLRMLQQKLLFNFVKLSYKLISELDETISKQININEQTIYKINWALKIQKITQLLFINAKAQKLYLLKLNVITSTQLAHYVITSLKLSYNRNSFIINSQQCNVYQQLNQIKLSVLFIIKDALGLLLKSKKNLSDGKFISIIQTIKVYLLQIIPKLANQIQQFPAKKITSQTIYRQALCVLQNIVPIPCLLNQLTEMRDLVLFRLCLPCFISTAEDKQLAAQDYCHKKQKIVDCDNAINLQQAAGKLVEAYCDVVYGSVPHLANSIINLMDFQLTADPRHYQLIPATLLQSYFFKAFTYFEQIEAGLSVMALLSYHADNRDDVSSAFQAFIVRRQQFFSRIDVPAELITSFLHCCAYYLSNFYKLILQGKANADFHRSLIFHTLQLINASYNPITKDYKDNNYKKIGIQANDYLSNVVIQQYLFAAIFPAHNQQSTPLLLKFISHLCLYFDSALNISVIQNILIDLVKKTMQYNYTQLNRFSTIPQPMRRQVGQLIIQQILINFKPNIKNQTIAKQKLLQLYQYFFIINENPTNIFQASLPLFNYIVDTQYAYIDNGLNILQIYIKRIIQQKLQIIQQIQSIILKYILKCMKICDNQTFQIQVFDIILNLNILQLFQQQITQCLLQIFQDRLDDKDHDQQAQIIIQKVLYLIMQIAYNNFRYVQPQLWIKILEKMIQYMKNNYVMQDTITIGKASVICLCCYLQDPQGVQNYLQSRMEGLWDCILDDQLKYSSTAEKKLVCLLLDKIIMQYSNRPTIKDKFPSILKAICIVLYYNYEKTQMVWNDNEDSDESMNEGNKSIEEDKKVQKWAQPKNTMRKNPFLTNLQDERALFRDICIKLNETNHQNFQKFINDLPLGIQSLVKNKIMMYRSSQTNSGIQKKMRTIYKIKKPSQEQQQ